MSTIWKSDAASIIAFPDEALSEELLPSVREWLGEGLLNSFVFVTPSCVVENPGEPPNISARILIPDASGQISEIKQNLFEILAEKEFKIVRLIGVRALRTNTKIEKRQNQILNKILEYVSTSLPQPSGSANELEIGTRFLKINLVVAPSELHSSEYQEAFDGMWSMHLVASPEDRSTPWTADALVRNDERFLKFLLMHVASAAGLWNGLPSSPFELVSLEKAQSGSIWLSRVFVSAILTEELARRSVAKAINTIANSSSEIYESKLGIYVAGTSIIPEEMVDTWVDWMIAHVFNFEDAALSFRPVDESEKPRKEHWYEWTQIKHFAIFAWDKLKVIPWWIWIWIRRKVGASLQRTFQGDDGLAEVGISRDEPMDTRDKTLALSLLNIREATANAKRALVSPLQRTTSRTSPKLWADIRRIVFGMLDGSDLKDMGLGLDGEKVPVFAKTSNVIQDPRDKYIIDDEFKDICKIDEISWKNLDVAIETLRHFDTAITDKKKQLEQILDEIVKIDEELAMAKWEVR